MLILLPPSEGKADPSPGGPVDLPSIAFARELGPLRERIIRAVDPGLAVAPAAPAAEVYTGVLYAHLDLASLSATARRRAEERVLIASGMWGLLRPADRIPAYKLPIGSKVKRMKSLAGAWRPPLRKALAGRDSEFELVVDCRSGAYSSLWKPGRAARIEVKALHEDPGGARRPISHMAKATRGRVARALLEAGRDPETPDELAATVAGAGFEIESDGRILSVIER